MGIYKIITTPEEDAQIAKLKNLLNEKTAAKVFRKLLTLRLDWEGEKNNGTNTKNS